MPLTRQSLLLFEILGEAAGRPVPVDEIAAHFYRDAEWPASYAEVISVASRVIRPAMAEIGLGVACRKRTYWLFELGDPTRAPVSPPAAALIGACAA